MKLVAKARQIRQSAVRFAVNGLPTRVINASYDTYSKIYQGQLNLGLPVSPELIISQEEIKKNAVGKLALTLYHIFFKVTQILIPRGVGVNAGRFDPHYTVDTLIDHDLPTVLNFITERSSGKPSILLGHSMGGLVSENMVLNWALRLDFDKIKLPDRNKKELDKVLVPPRVAASSLKIIKRINIL